jgi:asparagine synthase (glutamine-hydrolysing)
VCGIVGIVGDPVAVARLSFDLSSAVAGLGHRGPDDNASYQDRERGIYLGHTRLAVIDISAQARQPMLSKGGDYILAFNGEIYNFKELHQTYGAAGHGVNSRSDTAVLLNLLQQFGHCGLDLLNGMFAFGAVDVNAHQVLLARDRFGEKPLYWMQLPGAVAFASELHTFRTLGFVSGHDIDLRAVGIYQALGSIPPPYTIYRGLQAVMPGSYLVFRDGCCIKQGRYWAPEALTKAHGSKSIADLNASGRGTFEKLRAAVRSRMVSDVPVGLFLSGGYDSGSLLALCHDSRHPPAKLLCVDFEEKEFSEYPQAARIARYFGMDVERCVFTEKEFAAGLPSFFRCMDQPTADGFNTFFVSRAGRDLGIKVWLSGVGGDELFGGYPSFRRLSYLRFLSCIGQKLVAGTVLDRIAPMLQERYRWSRLLHLFDSGETAIRAFQCCRQLIPWRNVLPFFKQGVGDELSTLPDVIDSCFPSLDHVNDSFQSASILELCVYMRSQLLRDLDNFSMAHSIELRAPFLDHRLYHHLMGIKQTVMRDPRQLKPLLVRSLSGILPQPFLSGPKRGFTFPVEKWMQGFLKRSFEEIVLDPSNSDLYAFNHVKSMWDAYRRGKIHWAIPWNVYAFSRWRIEHGANAQ